jgi:hypothetical protein
MKLIESTIAVACLFFSACEARKHLVDEQGQLIEQRPVVLDSGDNWCIFKNNDDGWCITTDSPMLNIGWTYSQKFATTPVTQSTGTIF